MTDDRGQISDVEASLSELGATPKGFDPPSPTSPRLRQDKMAGRQCDYGTFLTFDT